MLTFTLMPFSTIILLLFIIKLDLVISYESESNSSRTTPVSSSPCLLGETLLNSLIDKYKKSTKEKDGYSLEYVFGLIGDDPGNFKEKKKISSEEFNICLNEYLKDKPQLDYDPNFPFELEIFVPSETDVQPGKFDTSYTTYMNPYNFKEQGLFQLVNKVNNKGKKKFSKKNRPKPKSILIDDETNDDFVDDDIDELSK